MLKSLKTTKLISTIILASILGACTVTPSQHQGKAKEDTVSLQNVTKKPTDYLNQINNRLTQKQKNRFMLLAAHAYLNNGDYIGANNILGKLKTTLTNAPETQAEFIYLSAISLTLQNKAPEALELLNYPTNWRLQNWQWINYHQFKAKLYNQLHRPIEEIKQLSDLSQYFPLSERGQINDDIWHKIQPLPIDVIASYTNDSNAPVFSGWMQLAYIVKQYAVSPNQLIRHLGQWQKENRTHPAALKLPTALETALNTRPYQPNNIAVLLPMTGKRANVANPIEQGILSSYIENRQKTSVKFYDTADGAIQAYQQAVTDGAEFIIGPLLPKNVEIIKQYQQEEKQFVPQLFLNQVDTFTPADNQFYFSLSPQEEASDAAQKLFDDNIHTPLILASDDATGRRMAESFNETWQKLTHKQAEVHFYQRGNKMRLAVQQAMGVTASQTRIDSIKKLLDPDIKADFRSRRDMDAIYMIADSRNLTLLKPFIDVNFSVFAKPVPLYTSSRGRLSKNTNKTSLELNNITISDIPWLMTPNSESEEVSQLWPHWNNNQKRLYAMGFDSYNLISRLAQMRAFSGYQFKGHSGQLVVMPNGVLNRHLSWGKYRRGELIPL